MALQTSHGGFLYYPKPAYSMNGGLNQATFQINAAGEAYAWVQTATQTATIRRVGFYVTAVGTSGDVDIRLETVDLSNGEPSGTLQAASATTTDTISATGWHWADFGEGNG